MSPVWSYIFVFTQPSTWPPPLNQMVSLASYPNCGWCVPKQRSRYVYFLRFRIEDRRLTRAALHWKRLGGGELRSLLAVGGVLGTAIRRRHPDAPLAVEHRVVVVDFVVPDPPVAPVWRRHQRVERCGMARTEGQRRVFAHRRAEGRPGVVLRVEHGDLVRRVLGRAVERAVGVDRRVAAVARDEIVQVLVLVVPVSERDHYVSLDALRPRGCGQRQLAILDTVCPVGEVLNGKRTERRQLSHHLLARLS